MTGLTIESASVAGEDGLFRLQIEEVETVDVEADGDVIAAAAVGTGIHAGDERAILAAGGDEGGQGFIQQKRRCAGCFL